jgi:hypothetical protein
MQRKVFKAVKNNLVRTVLGGGRMEGRLPECTVLDGLWEENKVNETDKRKQYSQSEPYWTASVRRGKKGHQDHQVHSSVNRVGRRLDGEGEKKPIKAAKKM